MSADEQAFRCLICGIALGVILMLGFSTIKELIYYFIKKFIRETIKDIEKEDNKD